MLFYFLLFVMPVLLILPCICFTAMNFWPGRGRFDDYTGEAAFSGFAGGVVMLIVLVAPITAWDSHATDLSTYHNRQHRIDVFEARVARLQDTLRGAELPAKPMVSLDADSPWAAVYQALAEAERDLTRAHDAKAQAILSIEARRNGPMSGVISFVGDYR